jgi:hypothetical protein
MIYLRNKYMRTATFLFLFGTMINASIYAANYYSDNNRDLFLLPRSSSVASSDFVFTHDGTNQTNPANLVFDSLSEISFAYAGFYQNTFSVSMLSYSTPVSKNSGIGFSAGYIYNPNIPITDNLETMTDGAYVVPIYDPSRISYRTQSELYFHFGYGYKRSIFPGIEAAAGVGFNALRHNLPPFRGYGIGADGGIAIDFAKIGLRTALICENITCNYTQWSKDWGTTALPHARFGLGWQKEIPYIYGHIRLQFKTIDLLANDGINASVTDSVLDMSSNQRIIPARKHFTSDPLYFLYSGTYGLEYTILKTLSLRVGIPVGGGYGDNGARIAFGGGVNLLKKKLSVDISYLSHELAGTYQLGVTYRGLNDIINTGSR